MIDRARPRRRLLLAQAAATVLMALFLTLMPAPRFDVAMPDDRTLELSLTRIDPQVDDPVALEPPAEPVAYPANDAALAVSEAEDPAAHRPESERPAIPASVDWYANLESVASRSDQFRPPSPSMSPTFDAKRRAASRQFAASRAPVEKAVWENVEMDQMGRKILWHENCFRVIEDNAVTRRWLQENFTQYLVFCNGAEAKSPIQIAFSDDRFAGYRNLTDPDGSRSSYGR